MDRSVSARDQIAKRRLLVVVGGLASCLAAPAPAQPTAVDSASDPVRWRSHDVAVPYRWTGASGGIQEVILFYSADLGRSWRRAGSATPQVRSFNFRAPGDGQYWFAIRNYDALGRSTPAAPLGPEMRVVIDTAAPQIERLDAAAADGWLTVNIAAHDADGFPPDAVRVYAQPAGGPDWTPVSVSGGGASASGLSATARWRPPTGVSSVAVRAVVIDRAGNQTERSATATVATPPPLIAGAAKPASAPTTDPFVLAARRAPAQPVAPTMGSVAPSPRRPARQPPSTPWPADRTARRPLRSDTPTRAGSPFRSAGLRMGPLDGASRFPALADDTPRRLVNSTRFEFDYELEDTGRWGVAKVELWGTDDEGRTWRRFAIDGDRRSPIHVTTPGEGRFGFRLVVEPVGGLEAATPRPGDRPEAEVVVDLHAPTATITSARQGDGYFADQLQIEWRVDDEHLTDAPIDLFYGSRPTGPWAPIAAGLDNTGRHDWRLQRHLPKSVYLRLETRDRAGNTTSTVTPDPVSLEAPTAGGSLLGVRAQSAR